MFSLDNFLFDHMPVKSRSILDELCDPVQAYWPDRSYSISCQPRRRCSNQQLYDRWVNCLMDEILDTPKEIEMEIERPENQPKEPQAVKEPMEVERCETTPKDQPSCNSVENCNANNTKALQVSRPTELSLRLTQYRPEDITCTVKDNCLTIKGKRQRKTSTSFCSQSFERSFTLPKDADHENILCSMDKNGLIKLNIPHKKVDEVENEVKEIKITNESNEEINKETEPKAVVDDEPVVEDLIEE